MREWLLEIEVRTYFGGSGGRDGDEKSSRSFCAGNHGVWAYRKFQELNTKARWSFAKEKHCASNV